MKCGQDIRPLCLTNDRVGWEFGGGRLEAWYRDAVYLPPDGWRVITIPPDWVRGEFGELRPANGGGV